MNIGPSYGWIQATNYGGLGTNYNLSLQPNGGNVGIGTTNPVTRLHIVGAALSGIGSLPSGVNTTQDSTSNNYFLFRNSVDNGTYAGIAMQDNNIGGFVVYGNAGAGDQMYIAGYYGVNIQYGSADSINPGARTTVGTFNSSGLTVTGNIYATGDIYSSYSDMKLKSITGKIENAIDKVCSIDTFYYEPNETAVELGVQSGRKVGVSAQNVQDIMPEVIGQSIIGEGYLTVQYERLVPLLIEAIKEQQKQIDELKKQVSL
jgi:hypothetical protein